MPKVDVAITQRFVTYPLDEWQAWRQGPVDAPDASAVRERTVKRILAETGVMGRSPTTYLEQALFRKKDGSEVSHNYSECKTAQMLVAEFGCSPTNGIIYENYRTSKEACAKDRKGALFGAGIGAVERIFKPHFFGWYDDLFDSNYGVLPHFTARPKDRRSKSAVVDLFGVAPDNGLCGFWEAKTYAPGKPKHEGLQPHQLLMLVIIRYLADTRLRRIAQSEVGLRQVVTEIVVLHEAGTARPAGESATLTYTLDTSCLDRG